MTTAEILRASLELLEDPDHWTQGVRAVDGHGRPIDPWDPYARQWCMEGAPLKVARGRSPETAAAIWRLGQALPSSWRGTTNRYNDAEGRQHSEILAVIRNAIELAEAEEQHA